jgi:hypothetical protein
MEQLDIIAIKLQFLHIDHMLLLPLLLVHLDQLGNRSGILRLLIRSPK